MNAGGFRVRSGVAADLEAVVALERVVVEAPHWGEAEYAAMVCSQDDAHVTERGGLRRCLIVAEAAGGLVGFAVGKVIGSERDCLGELESVVVAARARRGGVGRALCEAVVGWSRGQGAAVMELEVRAGSAGAIALYGELGFVGTGRRWGYYPGIYDPENCNQGSAEDALLMRLELAETK
jgi:ribosomal-protein-alanine N-acetyltransferase